ncbi:MAG: hypothetical protein L7H03_00805 [Vulcanisaeta sp.]|jgi:hypothetical protein|nr:MAG: hypothetical protein AT717_06980 [Vulcanisaeta sp. CIS_19]MCG2866816.1 hypothetical protein [Vulcanisaeta sp.]MCG2885012.1 hypothetical protein [Vulcanisaeta sp.]MDT7863830.1 hypothetical protein [Vulcanisaeta sp.]PVU72086.1 hypothetical protein DDW08_03005 [Vulcanisaeta sp. SCGC AB-777_J10]
MGVSTVIELSNKVFSELISNNAIVRIRERDNPLVSEYVFKYGSKCPSISVSDDLGFDREMTWYQVLTMGIGVKLSINRVKLYLSANNNNSIRITIRLMNGDRLKSSEELLLTCDGVDESIYGKTVIDALINLDLITKFLNMIKERRKLTDGMIDELIKFLVNVKSRVEHDIRQLHSMYQWLDE